MPVNMDPANADAASRSKNNRLPTPDRTPQRPENSVRIRRRIARRRSRKPS